MSFYPHLSSNSYYYQHHSHPRIQHNIVCLQCIGSGCGGWVVCNKQQKHEIGSIGKSHKVELQKIYGGIFLFMTILWLLEFLSRIREYKMMVRYFYIFFFLPRNVFIGSWKYRKLCCAKLVVVSRWIHGKVFFFFSILCAGNGYI